MGQEHRRTQRKDRLTNVNPSGRKPTGGPPGTTAAPQRSITTTDIFFVNGTAFFITLSRNIDFTAIQYLTDRKITSIFKAFKEVYHYYRRRGFRITTIHADGEFAPLQVLINDMPDGPVVNLASANEHVPEIERRIRVVKERARAIRHGLPFNKIPKIMIIHMVLLVGKLLTYFPTKGGISQTLSPRMIMSGTPLNYRRDLILQFGAYCQTHE